MAIIDSIIWGYEIITPFQATAILCLTILYIVYLVRKDHGLLPGPTGLPLLGYWPFLNPNTCHIQLDELKKKYGDMYSFRITGHLFICLGSHKALKELHVAKSDCFGDRCLDSGILFHTMGGGIVFLNGEPWKTMRKYFLLKFRDFGMLATKGDAACIMYDAMEDIMEEFKSLNGNPANVSQFVVNKCNVVVKRLLFNDEGITDEELRELSDEFTTVMACMTSTNILLFGNIPKYFILPMKSRYRSLLPSQAKIVAILRNIVNRYKSTYALNHTENIISCFFQEKDERKKKGDPTAEFFTDFALIMSMYKFFTDGGLTITRFVCAYLSTLLEHPKEQEKVYKELTEVIGTRRIPALEEKSKLPYTNAFIYEVLRYSDVFPIDPSRECKKDITVNGYRIPAGAITLMNMWSIHHDPNTYENPFQFDPSRYLATNDKPRAELPVTFGIGRRTCLGESFAMNMIFLFVTAIVKNFHLALPEGSDKTSMLLFEQENFKICFRPRSETKS